MRVSDSCLRRETNRDRISTLETADICLLPIIVATPSILDRKIIFSPNDQNLYLSMRSHVAGVGAVIVAERFRRVYDRERACERGADSLSLVVGLKSVLQFATPGWRDSPDSHVRQYEVAS